MFIAKLSSALKTIVAGNQLLTVETGDDQN